MFFLNKIFSDDYEEKVKDWIYGKGLSVVVASVMGRYSELQWGGKWYRSKDQKETDSFPLGHFMMNKKWSMEEKFTNHILHFHQVILSYYYFSKLHFDIPGWTDSH